MIENYVQLMPTIISYSQQHKYTVKVKQGINTINIIVLNWHYSDHLEMQL